jgi:hypothetical protein
MRVTFTGLRAFRRDPPPDTGLGPGHAALSGGAWAESERGTDVGGLLGGPERGTDVRGRGSGPERGTDIGGLLGGPMAGPPPEWSG